MKFPWNGSPPGNRAGCLTKRRGRNHEQAIQKTVRTDGRRGSRGRQPGAGQKGKLTAGEVVDRIKKNVGIPWPANVHRDSFKIGGAKDSWWPGSDHHMADLRVLQLAQKAGLNLVIIHEPRSTTTPTGLSW